MKRSKAYQQALEKIEEDSSTARWAPSRSRTPSTKLIQRSMCPCAWASIREGGQMVRGTFNLPHGTETSRVLVFAGGEKADEAREAGADFVGADDMLEKVKGGWTDSMPLLRRPT